MRIELWKKQNAGFKTLNLDGVLFLINDSSDELGQHYQNEIHVSPEFIHQILTTRKQLFHGPYIFIVVPDKSVLMHSYLTKYLGNVECRRPHVNALQSLDFCVDTRDEIMRLTQEHQYPACIPGDSHATYLSHYAVYRKTIGKLGITPYDYEITSIQQSQGDLCAEINHGTRSLSNLQVWNGPVVHQKSKAEISVSFEEVGTWQPTPKYIINQSVQIFTNSSSDNNLRVLVFHDSNLAGIERWYASHFRTMYFVWLVYNQDIIDHYLPDIILEITMERFLNDYRGHN